MFGRDDKFKWPFGPPLIIGFSAIILASLLFNVSSNKNSMIEIGIGSASFETEVPETLFGIWNPNYEWKVDKYGQLFVDLWGSVSKGLYKIQQRIFRY